MLGCVQQCLRLHTRTGAPRDGVWGSWPGSASPHTMGAGTPLHCSEERQEHLRTEIWPWGEHQGKHPSALGAPHKASLSLPKQVKDKPELPSAGLPCALST